MITKKMLVIFTVTLFIAIAVLPVTNAQIKNLSKQIPDGDANTYDLLIIAPKKFTRALKPLVTHKNSVGVNAKLITLDEVYSHETCQQGRDQAEKIKYFIKYSIEEWGIKYVLLVGDFRSMPVRYCYNDWPWEVYQEPRFISELYYADIYDSEGNFSSWDYNNNSIFGEWCGDEAQDKDIDLHPDVYVGRLACRNVLELHTLVNKIITYETTTYGSEWFKRFVVVGGDTYREYNNPNWTGYEGEEHTLRALENMSDFEHVKLWTSDGSFTGPRDVTRAINNGCGFIFLECHSKPLKIYTALPNSKISVVALSRFTINFMRNKNMLPILVVLGCHSAEFDVGLRRLGERPLNFFSWIPEHWACKLNRKVNGGSIATIGSTGLAYTKEDKESFEEASDYLYPRFFYEYGTNGTEILGEVWGKTISDFIDRYPIDWGTSALGDDSIDVTTAQQCVLLGDPSLKIGGYPQ